MPNARPILRRPRLCPALIRWVGLWVLIWGVSAHGLTWSAGLPVAGDGAHLWMAAPAAALPGEEPGPMVELLHADGRDDEPAWERVTRLRGRLAAMATPDAGVGDTDHLWLVFDGGAVMRVALAPGPLDDQWFYSTRPVANLPEGLEVVAAAAQDDTLWVWGKTQDPEVVARFDSATPVAQEPHDPELMNLVLGLPRPLVIGEGAAPEGSDPEPADSAEPADPAEPAELADPVADPVDVADPAPAIEPAPARSVVPVAPTQMLLVCRRGRWQRVAIPALGPAEAVVSLVAPVVGAQDLRPTRMTYARVDGQGVIATTQPVADGGWAQVVLDPVSPGLIRGLRVDGQLVVVRQVTLSPGAVQAAVVRGHALTPLGDMTIEPPEPGAETAAAWAVAAMDGGVGVVSAMARAPASVANHLAGRSTDEPGAIALGVMDLRGELTRPPAPLGLEPARPFADAADYLLMLTAVVGATLLLFSFWRRDPRLNQPRLPQQLVVADLWRRAAGGVIDLAISGMVVSTAMGLSAEDLAGRWPGRGQGNTLDYIVPGLLLIGLTVLHTTVGELFTARSVGKALARTRLAGLDGSPPSTGQVLVRGLLKPFDLIAYLLMVLPVVNPGRQRLADLIARTLVVRSVVDSDADSSTESGDRPDA